jgi:hypothetical protein
MAETVLVEGSAIVSKNERYRRDTVPSVKRGKCENLGHPTNECFARKNLRVSKARLESTGKNGKVL